MRKNEISRRGAVISGAYGMDNAGDDAVLAAILATLRAIDPELPVTVLARRPKRTAGRFGVAAGRFGVAAVHPFRVSRWLPILGRARLFVSGGGSLLQDVTSRRSLLYYLAVLRLAKGRGCAVMLYGCGVGPLSQAGRARTARVLNACADAITVRDRESLALLRAMGVTVPTALAADPALAPQGRSGEREPAAGFALRDWPGVEERVPALAAAARYAYETYRLTPVFFCLAPEDRRLARALCQRLTAEGVPAAVASDPRRLGRMSVVLSMRLHGLIFALRDGTPAAGLSYDPKVAAFCGEAVLPWAALEEADEAALRRLLDEAVHLDGEDLSAAREYFRARERKNGETAARLLAGG